MVTYDHTDTTLAAEPETRTLTILRISGPGHVEGLVIAQSSSILLPRTPSSGQIDVSTSHPVPIRRFLMTLSP